MWYFLLLCKKLPEGIAEDVAQEFMTDCFRADFGPVIFVSAKSTHLGKFSSYPSHNGYMYYGCFVQNKIECSIHYDFQVCH